MESDMYGKIFSSMFEGSMIGSGSPVFAVWSYVIANMMPDREVGTQVELNPKLLAFILGETEATVIGAIEKLCAPDNHSRTKEKDGRRLIRLGEFSYQVVNGAKYRDIRDEATRREQNRAAQERFRKKKKNVQEPTPA